MKDILIRAIQVGDKNSIQHITNLIARAVRDEMEDFHVQYLSDKQMKELNPLIRKGIYTMLFSLSQSDRNELANKTVQWYSNSIPNYWEDVELNKKYSGISLVEIESTFLNEQIEIGNIKLIQELRAIEILPSYDLKADGSVNSLKAKIRSHLKKETFIYNHGSSLYFKVDKGIS